MDNGKYLQVQQSIVFLSGLIGDLPLKEFIAAAEKADTIGPFVDPTLYMQAGENLGNILDLARALRNYQDFVLTKRKLGVSV